MRHTISISFVLIILWLLNSGHYSALMLCLGLISVFLVVRISHCMDLIDHESQPIHLTPRLPSYYAWLIKKIIRSNIDVVVCIWRGNKSISPCMATLPLSQQTDMGKVIYANSITLTPGTVAIDLEADSITVHSLTESGLAELQSGVMDRRVSQLESLQRPTGQKAKF